MKVMILGSYPPRIDDVANHTRELAHHLAARGGMDTQVVAVDAGKTRYGPQVFCRVAQNSRFSHLAAAEEVNGSGADIVLVEHDFSIYGGVGGEYLLDLLERLEMPYVMACHCVPARPNEEGRQVLAQACFYSAAVLAMSHLCARLLVEEYDVEEEKITVMYCGVDAQAEVDREALKQQAGLAGCPVVATCGLLMPGMGLEYGMQAIALVAQRYPNVHYLVYGQTHPDIVRDSGEEYRSKLMAMAENLGVGANVQFVNRYPGRRGMLMCTGICDVFLTPYVGWDKAVSSGLASVLAGGRACVSTPYQYAKEMLQDGCGMLASFCDDRSLAVGILEILDNPALKADMENKAQECGRKLAWPAVAAQYEGVFMRVAAQNYRQMLS
ncbi:glycosyltransferase [Ruminococcaceae bacterium OttesenSCG-928-O06]|nr:glycosyltransferase [Ruminococcaceae bacterium OttesenSCG-928-O06]